MQLHAYSNSCPKIQIHNGKTNLLIVVDGVGVSVFRLLLKKYTQKVYLRTFKKLLSTNPD